MKLSVISPIGTSPPVVTEFVNYVQEALRETIHDLVVIYTKDPYVKSCTSLVEQAVLDKYPKIHLHKHELEYEDLDSEEKIHEFMLEMIRILKKEVTVHKVDRIYINAAGGRKDSVLALSVISQFFPVNGIFHVIMPDVKSFNIQLERIKNHIEELGRAEDKRAYYLKHKNIFEPLMYPDISSYSVIGIPIVPYPPEYLQKLVGILKKSKTVIKKSGLSHDFIERCVNMGILHSDRNYLYPAEKGQSILRIIESVF